MNMIMKNKMLNYVFNAMTKSIDVKLLLLCYNSRPKSWFETMRSVIDEHTVHIHTHINVFFDVSRFIPIWFYASET